MGGEELLLLDDFMLIFDMKLYKCFNYCWEEMFQWILESYMFGYDKELNEVIKEI